MIYKILGAALVFAGFFIIKYFPDISEHQRGGMTLTGILTGIFILLIGIGLIIFG
jgi:hypothetical protein